MRTEARLFLGAAGFFTATALAYWFVTSEPAGTAMLGASVPAFAGVGLWLLAQGRRQPDGAGGEADGSGHAGGPSGTELGYFPSSSAWPFVLSAGVVVLANGLVFGPPVAVLGVLVMVAGVFGYAREADRKA